MKSKFLLFLGLVFLTNIVIADSIIINSPANNHYSDDLTQDFNFTVVGDNDTYNCSVIAKTCGSGFEYFVTEQIITNNTPTVKTGSAMEYKDYKWKVECDDGDNFVYSKERNLYLGTSNFRAMDSFKKFLSDFIAFVPKIISLVILTVIIGIVVFIGAWIKGAIKIKK